MTAHGRHRRGIDLDALRAEVTDLGAALERRRPKAYDLATLGEGLRDGTADPDMLEAVFRLVGDEVRASLLCFGYLWRLVRPGGRYRLPEVRAGAFDAAVLAISYEGGEELPEPCREALAKPPTFSPEYWSAQKNVDFGHSLFVGWCRNYLVQRTIGDDECMRLREKVDRFVHDSVPPAEFELPMSEAYVRLLRHLEAVFESFPMRIGRVYDHATRTLIFGTPTRTYTVGPHLEDEPEEARQNFDRLL